ncbi:hypothetical protein PITC_000880 [Penicillium italicum]|uniref:Uncharacterized protein n=1 Tax=Penicillium italicum TaxID=40296 RepID=A0A0A2KTR6_PENIT|nr:hypothetical protein PITC_000880 [Penicillium italicum]
MISRKNQIYIASSAFPAYGHFLTTVYGVGNDFDDTLIRSTQSILHSIAELSYNLNVFFDAHFYRLISRASTLVIRLMLAHHHLGFLRTTDLAMS